MENDERVLVVGLPETGKSSFIQALDEVLKHPATQTDLRSFGLADDRSYIQKDKGKFLAGEKIERTHLQLDDTSVELWFEDPTSGRRGRLHMPDKKGEIFQDQWVNRQWEPAYRESLRGISGALVFVRADLKSRNDERLGVLATEASSSATTARPWDMKDASPQVQLVDVLQFIAEHGAAPKPLRTAVLISAWDTIGGQGDLRPREPERFLEREWALLAQLLRANPDLFAPKIYGVSAYGGTPGELGQLAEISAHERAQLTEGATSTHDLTRPLRWLLKLDSSLGS